MPRFSRFFAAAVSAGLVLGVSANLFGAASACTRALYVGDDKTVITGRNMDWKEDMHTNLHVFPAGMERRGAKAADALTWTSRYGSVIAAGYDIGTTDGLNEKGLVANLLYLAESEYGPVEAGRKKLTIAAWAQYVLDNFATVDETIKALAREDFSLLTPDAPNGAKATLHLSISDASGDSAIFEYIGGKLVIHHGRQYTVMTNSPAYDKQLALNAYWKDIGGLAFLPGTNRAADRFARASFLLESLPKAPSPQYMAGVPGRSFANQARAQVLSLMRAVSVPLGITTPDQPNISSTIWRTASDKTNLVYFFDSATRPNTFWVDLKKLDLKPGAPSLKLSLDKGEVYSGEVSGQFVKAPPFVFLTGE